MLALLAGAILLAAMPPARAADPGGAGSPIEPQKRTKLRNRKTDAAPAQPPAQIPPNPTPLQSPEPATTDIAAGGWSIVLAVVRGEDRESAARTILARVRSEGGLPEAAAHTRGPATVIAVGDYPSGQDARAQAELKRIQEMQVGAARPYLSAYLAPPPAGELRGSLPQFNLLRAPEVYGDKALYTLQIGVYARDDLDRPTEQDLAEARRAAEQAALRLRQEGELAYYYHGPRRSMVTVGVFDTSDFDPQAPTFKSERLREAQKRFPYNLYNGEGIREKVKGFTQPRLQPSNLVAVPKR